MKNSLFILVLIFSLAAKTNSAQVGISYYPFQSIIAVNTNTEKMAWADVRMETNTFISNLNFEFNGLFNFKRTEWVNYYSGIGININPFYTLKDLPATNGYLVHFGARIKPFSKIKNLQVAFELSPYLNTDFSAGQIRTLMGLSYNF